MYAEKKKGMQYINGGGWTSSDRPVLWSSGPVWCSSSLIISDSGEEPLGMEGIFLFSCRHKNGNKTPLLTQWLMAGFFQRLNQQTTG